MEDDEQKIVSWVGRCSRRHLAACGYTDEVKLKAETKATKALHENTCRSYSPINYLNNLRKILYSDWSIKAENIILYYIYIHIYILYNTALCLIYLTVSIVTAHSQRRVRWTIHINGLMKRVVVAMATFFYKEMFMEGASSVSGFVTVRGNSVAFFLTSSGQRRK